MKRLWLIGGPMGVGKSTAGRLLQVRLPRCVYLDGDWCWDARPFVVTEETKAMVLRNIRFLLTGFLSCSEYENVVFTWVMHEQSIIDTLTEGLPDCELRAVSLVCPAKELERRLALDIAAGLREPDVMARALAYLPLYEALSTRKLNTGALSPEETAERIEGLFNSEWRNLQ